MEHAKKTQHVQIFLAVLYVLVMFTGNQTYCECTFIYNIVSNNACVSVVDCCTHAEIQERNRLIKISEKQ